MTNVEITNFQSIKHVAFEFEGFASIVGTNYIGKSAVLRAIHAALTNRGGTDFIRWGESFCEVKIKRPGLDLLWHKEEGHNFYKINGQEYKKIGRGEVPFELEKLRYDQIKIGAEKINLLYADQFHPLFLLDRTGSASTDLLTSIYNLDQIYKAKELCDYDIKTNKGKISFKEKDFSFSEKETARIEPFPKIKERFRELSKEKTKLESFQKDVALIKTFMERLLEVSKRYRKFKEINSVKLPFVENLIDLKENVDALRILRVRLQKVSETYKKLTIAVKLHVPNEQDLQNNFETVKTLKAIVSKFYSVSSAKNKLIGINSIAINDKSQKDAEASYSETISLKKYLERIKEKSITIKKLSLVKEIETNEPSLDYSKLIKLKEYSENTRKHISDISAYRKELEVVNKEIENLHNSLKNYQNCPACGVELEKA